MNGGQNKENIYSLFQVGVNITNNLEQTMDTVL